jgi:hypothetical protein
MKIEISQRQTELREKIVALMEKKRLRPAELARITGRSEGTISELINGKKQFTDKLLLLIYDSLKDYLGEETLVPTRQYTRMWNIAQSGKKASDMRLVVGNTGVGKSVVFRKFAEENESCWYIKIDRKEITWNRFLFAVATEMGVRLDRKRKRFGTSFLLDRIVALVEEKADSNPMLIVDEAEVSRNFLFKELKNLRTATEGLLNITVVSIPDVVNRIGRLAGLECRRYETPAGSGNYVRRWYPTREESNQFTTFARRISIFHIDSISTEDMARFCTEKGIANRRVIDLACARWWNYDEADRAIRRAVRMGIDLAKMTPQEFELL